MNPPSVVVVGDDWNGDRVGSDGFTDIVVGTVILGIAGDAGISVVFNPDAIFGRSADCAP